MEAGDAVNRGQMDAGDARTLAGANAYTDARIEALDLAWDRFQSDVWERLGKTDERISRNGAMQAAMAQMAINASGSRGPRGRVAVGLGFQHGEKALSVGYAKAIGARGSLSLGAAFSGEERSAGVGFGLDL